MSQESINSERRSPKMTFKDKLKLLRDEVFSYTFWKAVRCEFLVTLLYVFVGCGSSVSLWQHGGPVDELKIALSFGLAKATFIQCVGHISGGHLNPAITVAMYVTRNITAMRALCYIIAQCFGGIAGAGILYGLTPAVNHGSLGAVRIKDHLDRGQAFGVEFMITFILVFTFFANIEPKRADMGSRSLSIGLAVTLGHLFAYGYTGAGMNPARCLGPALIASQWADHWVYWIGPLMGGIIGGFTYEYTQDSTLNIQYFKRSFRRKRATKPLPRSRSTLSNNSISTEMTHCTPAQSVEELPKV